MPDTATQERAESEQVTEPAHDGGAGGEAQDALEDASVEPVAEPLEDASGEPVAEPLEAAAGGPVEEVLAEAAAAVMQEPVQEPVEQSVAESAGEKAEEAVQGPVEARATQAVVGRQERAGSGRALGIGEEEAAAHPIEFLSSIEVEAAAELGRAELTIGEVLGLRAGSVVQLNKMLGEPAELMVKDKLIARGEVVVVEDRFGLRITEVVARDTE